MLDENGCDVYNTAKEMLRSALVDTLAYIDSGIARRDTDMLHRQRVKLPDGSYRWVQGKTHDELNDAIVRTYVESGRINEFINFHDSAPIVKTNFRDFAENWFRTYKTGLKETSQHDYRYQLDHLLYPAFQNIALQDISLNDVQEFLNCHRDTARSTLRKSLLVLKQLYTLAIKEHLLTDNPIDTKVLKITSNIANERTPLTNEEFNDILVHLQDITNVEDRRLLALLLLTGMRRGEVLGLRWEDIDFKAKTIVVSRNVTYPDNEAVIGTPKSKKGFRTIPLDDRLIEFLTPRQQDGFLFGVDIPPSKSSFNKQWGRIKKQIDIHGATPHVFRHTYATALNNAGVPMKTIQSILGHADIATTMNIYTHIDVGNILEAGNKYRQFTTI